MSWKNAVLSALKKQLGTNAELITANAVGGGSINETWHLATSAGDYFIKVNSASRYPRMFEKEALGLKVLAEAGEIKVPEVVAFGEEGDTAFLILHFIKSAAKYENFWDDFAKQLAGLHKHSSGYFGLGHDNYIGSLRQSNIKHSRWTDFFREERLEAQVKLARENGNISKQTVASFGRFYQKLDEIFPVEPPALVHGDLWGGNFIADEHGAPVIIDPAVYYGHREMDLGMSQLFGGFSSRFYDAYRQYFPLEQGWQKRMDYCNLYPLMVHVNLFGGSYLTQVKSILRAF